MTELRENLTAGPPYPPGDVGHIADHEEIARQLNTGTVGTRSIRYLTADQSFANDTLVNVTELAVPVLENAVYRLMGDLYYDADAAADLKIRWTAPVGALLRWAVDDGASRAVSDIVTIAGDGTEQMVRVTGLLVMAATAGTLQLQAAQNTANATASKLLLQSYVEAWSP